MARRRHPLMQIQLRRAYDDPEPGEGARLLVERLWPRGVKKEALKLDGWLKNVAPSTALRKWFAHDPEKWDEFQRRYLEELRGNPEVLEELKQHIAQGPVCFIYAAKDPDMNSALLLRQWLEDGTL